MEDWKPYNTNTEWQPYPQTSPVVQGNDFFLKTAPKPTMWEKFTDLFGDDAKQQIAKSMNSMVYSEMFNIRPSTAYDLHDEISKQIQNKLPTEKISTQKHGIGGSVSSGLSSSIFGMMFQQKIPVPFESASQMETWTNGLVSMFADLPFFITGYSLGGANPITGTAGAFGFTEGVRQILIDRYSKGEVKNLGDFIDRTKNAVMQTLKGEVVGGLTGYVGKISPNSWKMINELGTMTTAGKLIEGEVPTAKDFIDNAAILLAMKGGIEGYERLPQLKTKLQDIYVKSGIHPKRIAEEIINRPVQDIAKDLSTTIDEIHNEIKAQSPTPEITTEAKPQEQPITEKVVAPEIKAEPVIGEMTSIKNASVDTEREAMGLSAIETPIRTRGENWREEVKAKVDSNEINTQEIARKINNLVDIGEPIPALDEGTTFALEYGKTKLKNEYKNIKKEIENTKDNPELSAELQTRANEIFNEISLNQRATKVLGTAWSDVGRIRQEMMAEDYSVHAMIQRAIEDGVIITPELIAKYEKLSDKIDRIEASLSNYRQQLLKENIDKTIKQIKNEQSLSQRKEKRVYKKEELDVEFNDLVKEFSKVTSNQLNIGIDPEAIKILISMTKNRIVKGLVTAEDIIDSIHIALVNAGLEYSKRDIRDAISNYGKTKEMSKEEIAVKLREAKRQMQLISAYEDAKKGLAPLKTGLQRDAVSERVRELQREVRQAMSESGIPITLESFRKKIENSIAEYERRLAEGDFSKRTKKELPPLGDTELQLKFKLDKVKREYAQARIEDQIGNRNIIQKLGAGIVEAINLQRAILTSFDLSAVLRQGGFIVLGHPIRGLKAFPDMFRALRSDVGRFQVEQELLHRPNYQLYEKSGLYLSEHGMKLSQMEEAYMSRWADKIWGVAASQRAYTTFLNVLRANSFDIMVEKLSQKGVPTIEESKAIANYINVATGRGNLGTKPNLAVGLNTILFAPRNLVSRFQLAMGQPLWKGSANTRSMIAKEYARFLTGLSVLYFLGSAMGADIELDPRSSDFGKIKFGNTRIDPLAGLSQVTVLMSRLISGETKKLTGAIVPIRGENIPYGSSNAADVIATFLRSKLSPAIGTGIDVLTGKNIVGQKVTVYSVPEKILYPLSFKDILNAMEDQGVPTGTALGMVSIFGMNLQVFDPSQKDKFQ